MKKRLFIAIDISDEARSIASDYMTALSSRFPDAPVKWERPEKLHLTAKFLGNTEETLLDRIQDLMSGSGAVQSSFDIEISGTGTFPSARSPRVLWLGVNEASGAMKQLAKSIDAGCAKMGFEAETRAFKPHLTLARIRDPRKAADLGSAHEQNSFGPITFTCKELVLYESQLGRGGSTYSKLLTAPFVH